MPRGKHLFQKVCSRRRHCCWRVSAAAAAGPLLTFYNAHFTVYFFAADAAAVATFVHTYNK